MSSDQPDIIYILKNPFQLTEAMLNSEEIKPIVLAIVELCLSRGILVSRCAFSPTPAAPELASWCFLYSPLWSHFFHYCLGDNLWYKHLMALVRLNLFQRHFSHYSLVIMLGNKFSIWLSCIKVWGARFMNKFFCIFFNDWMDCRDSFHVLCLYILVTGQTKLSMKCIGLWAFH